MAFVLGAAPVAALATAGPARAAEEIRLPGGPTQATDPTPVILDAAVYLPGQVPAPAVVLAHGFGGSRLDMDERAQQLADRGFVVLAYSARGFGTSTGQISMNAPDYEIADAQSVLDYLATRSEVRQDAPGDPVVGIAGGSYGGALALLTAGYDPRVDAVAADITWNDLESSLFGQDRVGPEAAPSLVPGVFKELWTGNFFGVGVTNRDGTVTECGRFTAEWCRAYTSAAADGIVTPESRALMRASSPGSVTDRITAPTLLMAGESDSLFPLAQANANAEQIMSAHPSTPVKVVWHGGGHDGGIDESERLDELVADWFDDHLAGGPDVPLDFELTQASGAISARNSGTAPIVLVAPEYPGIRGSSQLAVPLAGPPQRVLAPAGGIPATISSVPGIGGSLSNLVQRPIPGQSAVFESGPLQAPLTLAGASEVTVRVAATDAGPAATALFASLRIVSPGGRETLPSGLVAPVYLPRLTTDVQEVTIALPGIVADAAAGDRLRLVVSTTDFAYRLPLQPRLIDVSLATGSVSVPLINATPASVGVAAYWWLVGAGVIIALLVLLMIRLRPRHGAPSPVAEDHRIPLSITSVSKKYSDGYLAVDDVTFSVAPGTILGLLGPNGAGKTTTMRMVMGLIRPNGGSIAAFGEPVYPGAPVLSRIGSLVEGAGFLPHLTGRQNLDLYWRAAGRTHDEPFLDEVLEIADLGSAIDRRVRSYSQGMRQRLGIAQAMLGKPDILMLDEPTNGLDPPQIKAMREVLHRYADSGRTVIISSHLLSEVEQTCTDVVVMHRGRLVGSGSVDELLRDHAGKRLEDVFLEIVGDDLTVGLA